MPSSASSILTGSDDFWSKIASLAVSNAAARFLIQLNLRTMADRHRPPFRAIATVSRCSPVHSVAVLVKVAGTVTVWDHFLAVLTVLAGYFLRPDQDHTAKGYGGSL